MTSAAQISTRLWQDKILEMRGNMVCKCKGQQGELKKYKPVKNFGKMEKIVERIFEINKPENCQISYCCDDKNLMVCSPVGTESKFSKSNKANIVLSGFCTAPDAANQYLKDLSEGVSKNQSELKNAFNTGNMKSGIHKLLESIGVIDPEKFHAQCLDAKRQTCTMYTQMLCMIAANGSAESNLVSSVLMSEYFKPFTLRSLAGWVDRITKKLRKGGLVIVMGNSAWNLLDQVTVKENSSIEDLELELYGEGQGLRRWLTSSDRFDFKIIYTYHASALNRTNIHSAWERDPRRFFANRVLHEYVSEACNITPSPVRLIQNKIG